MIRLVSLVIVAAFTLPAVAQDEAKTLEGKYALVAVTAAGKQLPRPEKDRESFEIRLDKKDAKTGVLLAIPNDPKREPDPLNFVIDSANPQAIAFTEPGKKGGPHMHGVFKLDGKTLTICVVESDKPADRPANVNVTGEKIITFVLEKQLTEPKAKK